MPIEVRHWSDRERVALEFDEKNDRTHQEFADDADVNVIVARALKGGEWPPRGQGGMLKPEPKYADFSEVGDLRDMYERVERAKENFAALPASVRALAGHDPLRFVEGLEDENFRNAVDEVLGDEFGDPEPVEEPETPPVVPAPETPEPDPPGE